MDARQSQRISGCDCLGAGGGGSDCFTALTDIECATRVTLSDLCLNSGLSGNWVAIKDKV